MEDAAEPRILTVGHSTRRIEEFVALLQGHGVGLLMDIRTVPKSRHNPQFGSEPLAASLREAGIAYVHEAGLGGLRRPRKDSPNGAWQNESFRGYADYMQTEAFEEALGPLVAMSGEQRIALMCAEGNPFRCHRSLVADALLARGIRSAEITSVRHATPHRMTPFARVEGEHVSYPATSDGV
jgi:uncharacterized protein (DUF488 family)